jgi:hypothetical protein
MSIQFAAAVTLASFYVGLSLALGGMHPRNGIPLWFLVPSSVAFCGGIIATKTSAVLPLPWSPAGQVAGPPRRVHLSWRAAFRLPYWVPVLLIPWHIMYILRLHLNLGWIAYALALIVLAGLVIMAFRCSREIRLLRSGNTAMALVLRRISVAEVDDRVVYEFVNDTGTIISGRAWDLGYRVSEGSLVPVFYEAGNPRNHVIACACWFEAD